MLFGEKMPDRNDPQYKEKPGEMVKKVKVTSDYFNTIAHNEHEPNLIKAIIDEDVKAVTDKEIAFRERNAYNNPAVSMSLSDMTCYARRIWNSPAKYRNVSSREHRMTMRLNNIYAVGDYFFIDFSI